MRHWLLSLLSIFMLATAIALSSSALRLNATTRLQALRTNIPRWATTGTRTFTQTGISQLSTSATSMASTSPSPQHGDPDKASLAGAEILANKSNAEPALPKLSVQDFRSYNRLAIMMDRYVSMPIPPGVKTFLTCCSQHNHFRYTWNILYQTCTSGSRPQGMSLRSFISQGLHLCQQLTLHHTIEEQYIFPELAERMDAFKPHDHLVSQHEQIHEGLEKFEAYLDACRTGEKELRLPELKEVMDSFGTVLWTHLDDEVRMLGAENMRQFWKKEEIARMNW